MFKKRFINAVLLFGMFCLTGCNINTNHKNQVKIIEEFKDYYQYTDSLKGIEIYAWRDNEVSDWNCVLTYGTNRLKTVDEIKKLQDELPCPIDTMKEIVKFYHDYFPCPDVTIVSNPPTQEELSRSTTIEQMKNDDDFLDVLSKLGISQDVYFGNDNRDDSKAFHDGPFLVQIIPASFEFHHFLYISENEGVKQQRRGDLLGYIIRTTDVQDFTKEYPDIEYVICDSVYDYYNKNRIPFYQIVDDYDLDYIWCNGNLYRKKAK